ncbi:MAG: hypothetical protein KAR06_03630 [Deltaproteobacteria bacterium]|nr:hypothetical protein [Deltaproteobacteria bacterium]
MAKEGIVNIHGKEYKTVALRVNEFRDEFADAMGITTEIIEANDKIVIMKASIINPEGFVVGTGHAEEQRNSTMINKTSALENCETSAIGRALAACGFAGTEYASANEVENAIHQQQPLVKISKKVKDEVVMESTLCLERGDDEGLRKIWDAFGADEKVVLWGLFNSQQRSSMKKLMKGE